MGGVVLEGLEEKLALSMTDNSLLRTTLEDSRAQSRKLVEQVNQALEMNAELVRRSKQERLGRLPGRTARLSRNTRRPQRKPMETVAEEAILGSGYSGDNESERSDR